MRGTIEFIAYTALAPAAAALFVAWLCRRLLPADVGPRYSLAAGAAAGFAVGYELLPDLALFSPQRNWQWLPHLALATALLGPVSLARGVRLVERWLLYAALSLLVAWQLVPTYESLQPWRAMLILFLTGYLFLLVALLAALPARLRERRCGGLLAFASVASALLVAYETSAAIGLVGAAAAAALAGCSLLPFFQVRDETRLKGIGNGGLLPVYVTLVGGLAFVGAVQLDPIRWHLLLAPSIPLVLWLFAFGPLAPRRGVWEQPDD